MSAPLSKIRETIEIMAPLLTHKEACERIRCHPATLRRWVRKGLVPCMRTPTGSFLYNESALTYALEQYAAEYLEGIDE